MRILIFSEVFIPHISGVASYVDVLKKDLTALGNEVMIVTSSPTIKEVFYSQMEYNIYCPAKKADNKYGFECTNIKNPNLIELIMDFHPDVVHIHTDTKIGYLGLTVADKCSVPVVFTIHDYFMDRFAADSSRLLWEIKTRKEKAHFCDMLDNADVVTSSCSRAAIFVQKAERERRVVLVHSNTDTDEFDYRRTSDAAIRKLRVQFGLSPTATVAVFAGQLTVEKNLEFVLTAFSKYIKPSDNIQLLLVGDGTETNYLHRLCHTLKLEDRVFFTGSVANSLMPAIYASCDVYVCSSEDSLMSMSFVEAMSCGLPVLVKEDKEGIVHKTITHGVNGFVYKNKQGFAAYLKRFASLNEEERSRIREGVRNSLVTMDAGSMGQQYLKVYNIAIKKYKSKRYK